MNAALEVFNEYIYVGHLKKQLGLYKIFGSSNHKILELLEVTNCAYLSTNVDLVVVVVVVVVVTVVLRLGHFCVLQVLVSNGDPEHLLPPFLAI